MNKDYKKIVAVVVTYNRKNLLLECLQGILKQTQPINKIFLIDNASTDGTEEMMKEHFNDNTIISYIRISENTGASGGFYEGIKRAYEYGADWIWTMDDDVEPFDNALETQLTYSDISECIHPRKKYIDGSPFVWEGYLDWDTATAFYFNKDVSFDNEKRFISTNMGCFEGMLISRRVVEKIGYPDKRFFLNHDDMIYGFLASLWTNVIVINNFLFVRKIGSGIPLKDKKTGKDMPISNSLLYYSTRNRFLVAKHLNDLSYLNKKRWILSVIIVVIRGIYNKIFVEKSFKRLIIFLRAIRDGIFSKWGRCDKL